MSAAALTREMIVTHTRALKLPGVARAVMRPSSPSLASSSKPGRRRSRVAADRHLPGEYQEAASKGDLRCCLSSLRPDARGKRSAKAASCGCTSRAIRSAVPVRCGRPSSVNRTPCSEPQSRTVVRS